MMATWQCNYCTYLNDQSSVLCGACGSQNTAMVSTGTLHDFQHNHFFTFPKLTMRSVINAVDSALVDIRMLPTLMHSSCSSGCFHSVCVNNDDITSTDSFPPSPLKVQSQEARLQVVSSSSFCLLQNDEKSAAQEYDRIIQFCKENNIPFIDDSFPHSKKSIGNFISDERLRNVLPDIDDVIWLRPQNIHTKDGRRYRWSVFLDPKPSDIEQGCLGNCWFLSALAVISERPDILDQIVLTKVYNPWGVYQIRLCVDGRWQVVIVDDFFPCHSRTRGLVFAVGRRNQLWVPLIEKALAKIFGCYGKLPSGRTLEGLAVLTGLPCTSIDLENSSDYDLVWARLLSMREAGFIMGCSCGGGKRYVDEEEFRSVGLQIRHAYSLLDVKEYKKQRLVRLRNPWGSFTWNGPWCDHWPHWDESSRRVLLPNGPEAGAFWMPFQDFMFRFDSVEVAKVRSAEGWKELRVDCTIPKFWGKENVVGFQLQVEESTELAITVYQKGFRDRCGSDIMVLLHKGGISNTLGELIVRSTRYSSSFTSTGDVFLKGPALYTVLVISFSNISDAITIETVVAVHSAKMVMMEDFHLNSSIIAHSMIEMCLKEGENKPCLDGTLTRFITSGFGGHILMVENHHQRNFLHVYCDCSQSSNILSTRASLTCLDSVPPMHRQILILLTHFEPSQMFTVCHNLLARLSTSNGLQDWLSFASSRVPLPSCTEHVPDIQNPCLKILHKPYRIG